MAAGLLGIETLEAVRARRSSLHVKVVGITGTAGKTTTNAMIAGILQMLYKVVATTKNANLPSHVARYIWDAEPDTEALVLEIGMDRRGQIRQSSYMARPDVAVVTNVSQGHVEKCGGFSGVIKAKSEIIHGMGPNSVLVLNSDDQGTKRLEISEFQGRIVTYGRSVESDYRLMECEPRGMGLELTVTGEGVTHTYSVPTIGQHNCQNAVAAIAAARALGVPWDVIKDGFAVYKQPQGRLTPICGLNGALVIDDSFNANPLSVVEGLKTLKVVSRGRSTIAVLGNMEEQGKTWRKAHMQVGRSAAALGIDHLITVGKKARYIAYAARQSGMPKQRIHAFLRLKDALAFLKTQMARGKVVFLKGSHSTRVYRLVEHIT